MRRIKWLVISLLAFQLAGPMARAESSIDALENDLNDAEKQHQDATSKQFSDLITELDKALADSNEALTLYQNAGGDMPLPAPVLTVHDSETPDEKAARDALDQANENALINVIQLHCGVMRFAAFFTQHPDEKGLHDAWVAWLKQAAQIYPQAGNAPADDRPVPPTPAELKAAALAALSGTNTPPPAPKPKKKPATVDASRGLKDKAVRDSIISQYLNYNGWGDKDPGNWRVRDIPRLYRQEVLEPLRTNPTAATLGAWDTYIAMRNVDAPDPDTWANVEYPSLMFQRGCDAYYASPDDEKLETLVTLIKNNPTHPDLDQWIPQVKQMIQDFRTFKSSGKMPSPGGATNAAPAAPATTNG